MVPDKDALVDLLRSQFKSLDFLGSSLTPAEWHAKASLPGWQVFDIYAHIIGTESMLDGFDLPGIKPDVESFNHVRNEIGVFNETWIESLADLGPAAMLDRFREVTDRRVRALTAMGSEDFEAETATPVGPAPYWRFMQIRLFDCWMHEQDVREGLGRPGHESGPCARAAVDEAERALGYVVGRKAKAPIGSSVTVELTGPVKRTIHVMVGERAEVVDELPETATAMISMSSSLFMRLAGGRSSNLSTRLGTIDFGGDLALAQKVATNLTFTP